MARPAAPSSSALPKGCSAGARGAPSITVAYLFCFGYVYVLFLLSEEPEMRIATTFAEFAAIGTFFVAGYAWLVIA